jgi:hypothetical protein
LLAAAMADQKIEHLALGVMCPHALNSDGAKHTSSRRPLKANHRNKLQIEDDL